MADPVRLASLDELGERGVVRVSTPKGTLAVGIANGEPFAVSDRCRHLGASLGKGTVTPEGCLECPWHHAEYDVRDGRMLKGPQGAFRPIGGVVTRYVNAGMKLKVYPVVERDGILYLAD